MSQGGDQEKAQEKSEPATPYRREKAREQGQVPRTNEIYASIAFLVAAAVLFFFGERWAGDAANMMSRVFRTARPPGDAAVEGMSAIREMVTFTGSLLLPLFGVLFLVVLVLGVGQGQFAFSLKPVQPRMEKISPVKGFKRIFGLQAVAQFVKQVLRLAVIGFVAFVVIRTSIPEIVATMGEDPGAVAMTLVRLGALMFASGALVYFPVALIDYGFEVVRHERQIRMTKDEVREESKTTEGNPWVRGAIRAAAMALSRGEMIQAVRKADVLVANPYHRAVAITLEPDIVEVPIILAIGVRHFALRLRREAEAHGVPVVEDRNLAKLLVETGEVGKPVPEETLEAVSQILSFVYRSYGLKPSVERMFDRMLGKSEGD